MTAENCIQLKTGSCLGCNVLNMVANRARWQAKSPQVASEEIAKDYCPKNTAPQHHLIKNEWASVSMGQLREESLSFPGLNPNPSGEKLHRRY